MRNQNVNGELGDYRLHTDWAHGGKEPCWVRPVGSGRKSYGKSLVYYIGEDRTFMCDNVEQHCWPVPEPLMLRFLLSGEPFDDTAIPDFILGEWKKAHAGL